MNEVEEHGLFVRGLSYMVYYNVLRENLLYEKQAENENKNTRKDFTAKRRAFPFSLHLSLSRWRK